ncbi:ATP-dependent zinc protease [Pontivivens ytuae]|uniref:ATP-dependent zinc protease n=1 Tax=Pontivivens ytuae TaxID=2789856 RepID=A0A7S9LP70_9RHOB|nr:RimK/LysX family protein [Pontivivens ytuae]QPH52689.1 ATP-dependent zinc protease [Pontivivens ytuae]
MDDRLLIGWREQVELPDLGGLRVRAKIDTGAKTSALHARNLRLEKEDGKTFALFEAHSAGRPKYRQCRVEVAELRRVRSSNGQVERRPTIRTTLSMGGRSWPIYVTLTDRELMTYAMLIGREALDGRTLIDSQGSWLLGRD